MNLTTRVGQFCACCARAAIGHAAALPRRPTTSRRFMAAPWLRTRDRIGS